MKRDAVERPQVGRVLKGRKTFRRLYVVQGLKTGRQKDALYPNVLFRQQQRATRPQPKLEHLHEAVPPKKGATQDTDKENVKTLYRQLP